VSTCGSAREKEREIKKEIEVLSWVLAGVNPWDAVCGYGVVGI